MSKIQQNRCTEINKSTNTMGCFIYILDSSNSSSITVSWALALEATEPLSEPVTQMADELINNHLISLQ